MRCWSVDDNQRACINKQTALKNGLFYYLMSVGSFLTSTNSGFLISIPFDVTTISTSLPRLKRSLNSFGITILPSLSTSFIIPTLLFICRILIFNAIDIL